MSMDKVRRDQAVTKAQFHQRLRSWFEKNTDDAVVGPENVDGRSRWIHIRDGSNMFVLHADTKRDAVDHYLRIVARYGDDLQWTIAPSQRGKPTAVVHGSEQCRLKSFYLYLTS
jgi:hypothetical protein